MRLSGWDESRLLVENEFERSRADLLELRERLTKQSDHDKKADQDIHEAHGKIRKLETSLKNQKVKTWVAIGAASFLGALTIELIKILVTR